MRVLLFLRYNYCMRRPVLLLAMLCLPGAALGQTPQAAASQSCAAAEQASTLPGAIQQRIVYGRMETLSAAHLRDGAVPTASEAAALTAFIDHRRDCVAALRAQFEKSAPLRLPLLDANEKILADLAARKISYGTANARWAGAQYTFDRIYGQLLEQQTQAMPLPVNPFADAARDAAELDRQNAEATARSRQMIEDAIRANQENAARGGICPPRPMGAPEPLPDPLGPPPVC